MDTNTVRSPDGSGSRASHEAVASPSSPKASIPSADTRDFRHTFYAILNPYGEIWTPLIFESEEQAIGHIDRFWGTRNHERVTFRRRCKIVPARAVITIISDSDGSREAGETTQTGSTAGDSAGRKASPQPIDIPSEPQP